MNRTPRLIISVFIFGVSIGLVPDALAEKPKVLLIPYQPIARQASPELAAQVTKALVGELASAESFAIEPMEAEALPEVAEVTDGEDVDMEVGKKDLAKAYKRLNAASRLMKKYRFDQAIGHYKKSIEHFEQGVAAVEEVQPIADAYVQLGVAAFRRSKEDMAEEALAQAVVLDPERTLDARDFPPLLLRVYDDIYRKTLSKKRGAIAVEAGVVGAEVFYNGRSVGVAPIKLIGVPPGRHFLRVVKEGAGVFGSTVAVPEGETVEVNAELGQGTKTASAGGSGFVAVAAAVAANRVDVVVVDAAVELGKQNDSAFVVFGGLRKGEASIPVASYLVDVQNETLIRLIDIDIDLDMLSVSIEAFKLTEDLNNNIEAPGKDLGPGPHTIVRGVASEESKGPSEVNVGPAIPDGRSSRVIARSDGGRRAMVGDDDKRNVIDTGDNKGGRRRTLSDDGDDPDDRETIGEIDEPDEWYENHWVWIGAGGGTAVVAAAATGGVIAFMLLRPPESVTINADWP